MTKLQRPRSMLPKSFVDATEIKLDKNKSVETSPQHPSTPEVRRESNERRIKKSVTLFSKKDVAFEVVGPCPFYSATPGCLSVFIVNNRIFYIYDDGVYYTDSNTLELTKTKTISRHTVDLCYSMNTYFSIQSGKVTKSKETKYSTFDSILLPIEISSDDNEVYIINFFGEVQRLNKDGIKHLSFAEKVFRCVTTSENKAFLLSSGRLETSPKTHGKKNIIDIVKGTKIWCVRSDCYIESIDGVVVDNMRMLRVYSGYGEIVGENEETKLCKLRLVDGKYQWEVLKNCEGRQIIGGANFVVLGKPRDVVSFLPFILQARKLTRQIEAYKEYYETPIGMLTNEPELEEKAKTRRSTQRTKSVTDIKKDTGKKKNTRKGSKVEMDVIESLDTFSNTLELFSEPLHSLLKLLWALNMKLTRLYTTPSRDECFGEAIKKFLEDSTKYYLIYAKEFVGFCKNIPKWKTENPWKSYEEVIPNDISRVLFDKRADILTVLFSPFKLLSLFAAQLAELNAFLVETTDEYMFNKNSYNLVLNLLDRVDETLQLGNTTTWGYLYSNENWVLVLSTGTIDDIIEIVQSGPETEVGFSEVFINTITLYSPISVVLGKLLERKGERLPSLYTQNVLEILKLWLKQDPLQFNEVTSSVMQKIEDFLIISKKDSTADLKDEVVKLLNAAKTLKAVVVKELGPMQMNFTPNDLCKGFDDHGHFADIMTYIHKMLFNAITERDIVLFFKKTQPTNIKRITTSFNWLSELLSKLINTCPISFQTVFFDFTVKTAERFYTQHNFFGLCAIVFAFHKVPDFGYVKSNLSKDSQSSIEKFEKICSFENNYSALRNEISKTSPPLIPFGGILTKDLLVVDEMYASFIKKTGHFNVNKLRTIHKVAQLYESYKDKTPLISPRVSHELLDQIRQIHNI
ncbi:hypothetical protein EIN_281740 [Entamoeba invadens IP1]|uniref:Guanine nucleotide exchange factor n=1 Tax=Entamoeba invadens IP1 TaxID=370355 RepID=A0A0A1TX17_ENTIV|nr:hypothetical protein EIN_281740 [Entamoeba invadens IP1]ELP85803.1 hypothetical protein EIN_281740 [Entamoeba invadens IP1]|eukprot:XP_004185149.1 hypothetical protein EIN_281740 [Entamoeba invadens IP1]